MTHRTIICVLLAIVPLVSGCGLFHDGYDPSPTPVSASSPTNSPTPTAEPTPTTKASPTPSPTPLAVYGMRTPNPWASPQPTRTPTPHVSTGPRPPTNTLERRIQEADVIARARLLSVSPSSRSLGPPHEGRHRSFVEYAFVILDTLKGKPAGDTVVVELPVASGSGEFGTGTYATASEAIASGQGWINRYRDPQWDDRDAIIFLSSVWNSHSPYRYERHHPIVEYAFVHYGEEAGAQYHNDTYSIDSGTNWVWLPAVVPCSATASNEADLRYLSDTYSMDSSSNCVWLPAVKPSSATAPIDSDGSQLFHVVEVSEDYSPQQRYYEPSGHEGPHQCCARYTQSKAG